MKLKILNITKVICFLLIFAVIFQITDRILVGKTYPVRANLNDNISPYMLAQKTDGFYDLDENTIDVVFMGSSHIHCGINPLIIWEKYGYTSYDMSADQQDMATAYYYCKEVFKTQSPKKIVVTIDGIPERQTALASHFSFDFMPLSLNKIKGVIERAPEGEYLTYLSAYPEYHTRWQELSRDDFEYLYSSKEHTFNGYFAYCAEMPLVPQENQYITSNSGLSETQMKYIDMLYELCIDNSCELEFIKTPSAIGNNYTDLVNSTRDYVKDRNIKVTDYSFDDRTGMDWNRDFADDVHANIYGSEKFSIVLGADILEGMDIEEKPAHIQDKYNKNLNIYRRYVQNYELTKISDMESYLNTIMSDHDYVAFVVGKGEPGLYLNYDGFTSDEMNNWTYISAIKDGTVVFQKESTEDIVYSDTILGNDFVVKSSIDTTEGASILMNYDYELCNNQRGLNIVVFDLQTETVVETRAIDLYLLQYS